MPSWLQILLACIGGGLVPTVGIMITWRRFQQSSEDRSLANNAVMHTSTLQNQIDFQNQLMETLNHLTGQIEEQSSRIGRQDVVIRDLRDENNENKKHREICEKQLAKAMDRIDALEKVKKP